MTKTKKQQQKTKKNRTMDQGSRGTGSERELSPYERTFTKGDKRLT